MSFRICKVNHRPWPVTITLLACDEAGDVTEEKHTFVGHFKPFTEEEFDDLVREAANEFPADEGGDGKQDIKNVLKRNAYVFCGLMVGWGKEVTDEYDEPIPFSGGHLRDLVTGKDGLAVSNGINQAVNQLRFGIAPAKNSKTSPEPGLTPEPAEVENEKKQS